MYYHTFSKLADHRWIEEKGYIKMHHILLFTRATPGIPSPHHHVWRGWGGGEGGQEGGGQNNQISNTIKYIE